MTALALERAAVGLKAAENLDSAPMEIRPPESNVPSLQIPARPVDEVRRDFSTWVIGNALRDFIEDTGLFLEDIRQVCAFVSFGRRPVPGPEWHKSVMQPGKAFGRLGLPQKIERLRKLYGDDVPPTSVADHVLAINCARKCLVHRRGVVGDEDCNDGQKLSVTWRSVRLAGRDKNGVDVEVKPGVVLLAGTQLLAKFQTETRAFAVGEQIAFGVEELAGMWFTFHMLGVLTTKAVVEHARKNGLLEAASVEPVATP